MSYLDYSLQFPNTTCFQLLRITLFVGDCINRLLIALMCVERRNRYELQNCVVLTKYLLKQSMNTTKRNRSNVGQKHTQVRTSVHNCKQTIEIQSTKLTNICRADLMTVVGLSSCLDAHSRSPLTTLLVTIFAM